MFAQVIRGESELATFRKTLETTGQIVVATNGCFDLLHRGHIENLAMAASHGDILVVGLNSDASVRMLKGPRRPVQNEEDRARILSALWMVGAVYIFEDMRATRFLELIRPHVYVKGGDYSLNTMDITERLALTGSEIIFLPRIGEYSTTHLLSK